MSRNIPGSMEEPWNPWHPGRDQPEASREPVNPYLAAWTRPRAAIREVVATKPEGLLLVFVVVAGFLDALDRASGRNAGDEMSMGMIFAASAIGGPIGGVLMYALSGWLISVTGRWLGGEADAERTRYAIGWTAYMSCVLGLFWVPLLAVFGAEMFTNDMPSIESRPELAAFLFSAAILELALAVWVLVCMTKMVGEVHGFSAWRGLGAMLLAGLLVLVPLLAVVFAVAALM